jgi:hypothetical protein
VENYLRKKLKSQPFTLLIACTSQSERSDSNKGRGKSFKEAKFSVGKESWKKGK